MLINGKIVGAEIREVLIEKDRVPLKYTSKMRLLSVLVDIDDEQIFELGILSNGDIRVRTIK